MEVNYPLRVIKKMMVKNIKLFFSIFLSVIFLSHANAVCKKDGGKLYTSGAAAAPVQDVGDAFGDSCNDVPDVYQIGFYRMSMCSENPDPVGAANPDFSSCQDMLADTGALTTVEISGTSESTLSVPEFTIAPGSYGYMVARLSAKLGIKHAFEATAKVVSNSAPAVTRAAGSYCWTVNNFITGVDNTPDIVTSFGTTKNADVLDHSNFACSDTASDMSKAEFTYEIVYVNDDSGCGGFKGNGDRETFPGNVGNGIATSRMMQNATTSALNCADASSILWTVALDTPHIVTTESNFQMNFKTTDAISIDFDNGAVGEPGIRKAGANPIQANLTVSEPSAPE